MEKNLYTNGTIIDNGDDTQVLLRNKLRGNRDVSQRNRIHIVKDGERLDQISYTYYGSNRYWWVIADYNDIEDILINPFVDIQAGQKLIVPDIDFLENKRIV